jgi:ABC-2 type transport system permease protein
VLLFPYAFSWIMAYVGHKVGSVEAINNASSLVIFPLTFIANTLVPTDNFATPLRTFAEWNPVSKVAYAARVQFGNIPEGAPGPTAWPLQNAALCSLGWVVIIVAVFAPLAVRPYQNAASGS